MTDIVTRIASAPHPYVIAEIGINHNGDMGLAREMIDAAREAGADCVKFQSFSTERLIAPSAPKAPYQNADPAFRGKSQFDIIKECELSPEQIAELKAHAEKGGGDFLSTPFETWSLRTLIDMGIVGVKISSCNLTNIPFLEEAAESGLPILLSTGMGDLSETARAVEIFKRAGSPLLLFQCTSNYPARIDNANLRVIDTFRRIFETPVGFSDHTPGNTAAIAAVALGAAAIEKHFTLSRTLPGIDQRASIEPDELRDLVASVRDARAALGSPVKICADEEAGTRAAARKSLAAARDWQPGEVVTTEMVTVMRPGTGLTTDLLPLVVGRSVKRPVAAFELFGFDALA